jgi:hypothetical protein
MNQTIAEDVTTIPRIMHDEAMHIAAAENAKFAALLRTFEPDDAGTGGENVDMDANEFCRILAERGHGTGIMAHPLPL